MKNLLSGPLLNGRYMEWTHGDCNYYSILQQLMSGLLGQILYEKWRNNSEQMEDSAHLMIQDSHGIHAQVEVKTICWEHKGFSRKIWQIALKKWNINKLFNMEFWKNVHPYCLLRDTSVDFPPEEFSKHYKIIAQFRASFNSSPRIGV